MSRRRASVATLSALVLTAVMALPGAPASAHAAYRDSDPGNRSTVASPPSSVWAEFTEPVQNGARLEIYDPCGTQVDGRDSSASGYRVNASMSADKAGTYKVTFAVVSVLDGHPTRGQFTFTSSGGSPCPGAEGSSNDGGGGSSGSSGSSGNSGSSGSSGAGASGSADRTSGTQSETGQPSETQADQVADDGAGSRTGGKKRRDKRAAGRGSGATVSEGRGSIDVDDAGLLAAEGEQPSVPGDIPVDGLLMSFGIAGLIGAAAGKVYAGIVGPRRRD